MSWTNGQQTFNQFTNRTFNDHKNVKKYKVANLAKVEFDNVFNDQFEKGFRKYGVELETFNHVQMDENKFRDAYIDSMQEVVDLINYMTQLHIERKFLCRWIKENIDLPEGEFKNYVDQFGT